MSIASTSAPVARGQGKRLSIQERLTITALSLCAITLLCVAAWLQPSSEAMGTHTQLGIPACSWPATIGLPCPSCGMTTAFALAADGRFFDSFLAQPMGFMLAVATAGFAVVSAYAALTGSRMLSAITDKIGGRFWWFFGAAILLSWGYKMLTFRGLIA
jgi:hypothetical protein